MKPSRTSDAVARMLVKVKEGKPCNLGGYLPPWFKYDKAKNASIPQPERIATVKRIFNDYLSGKGTTAIVKGLVKDKVPKFNATEKRNTPWKAGGIRSMLFNKQVVGTLKLLGQEFSAYLTPTVDQGDFDEVQVMLSKNTSRHGKHDGNVNNLFNRHVFCAKCGSPLNSMPVRNSGIDRANGVLERTIAVSVFAQPRLTAYRLTQSPWTGPWPPFGNGHVGNPPQRSAD